MFPFFRKIRYRLAQDNKFLQYSRYAIGEILLVVIGILIALQINNWNELQKNKKLERRYLTDLIHDLQKDSLNLIELMNQADETARSKDYLNRIMGGEEAPSDSIIDHFRHQWEPYQTFNPVTITIDEMKNSSNLDILRNHLLKREIVGLYNAYNLFIMDEKLFHESTRDVLSLTRKHLPDININTKEDVIHALQIPEIKNTVKTNFANGRKRAVESAFNSCTETLGSIREYLNGE